MAYWISGRSTNVMISFGIDFVAGRKRVPNPATGKTAFRTFLFFFIVSPLWFSPTSVWPGIIRASSLAQLCHLRLSRHSANNIEQSSSGKHVAVKACLNQSRAVR
ncbi:MAG: hypothetical protein ACK4GO_02110 [Gemmobacter sp.]